MASILEGELAAEVADALSDVFYACRVTRVIQAGPGPDPGVPTLEPHDCLGIVDSYREDFIDGTLVQANDRKVLVLAATLAITPQPGDAVTIRGETGIVARVSADPALATYELQVKF